MRIICLSCGHKVDVGNTYDDYEGQIKCAVCGALLKIKTEEGKLKSVDIVTSGKKHSEKY